MTTLRNKRNIGLVLFALVVVLAQAPPALAASLNNDPQDFATLRVTNYTSNPDCNACWSTTANVGVGEIVAFAIYYHNTGPDTATNVKARINTSISSDGRTISASGNASADNAGASSGNATVTLSSGSKATSLTHLATIWRPNQTTSGSAGLPFGQNGTEVYSGSGLNIGSVASGWPSQGSVIVRYRVEGTKGVSDGPTVTTFSATGIDRESARLRGEANPRGDSTRVWFEWGRSSSNLNRETSDQSIGSGNSAVEFSSSISGLDPDTTYYFRAIARNSFGTVRGDIRSFDTLTSPTVSERPQVRVLSATNITTSSASVRGEVNPNGCSATTFFEWSTDQNNLVNRTGTVSAGSDLSFVNISSFLSGLNANTTYFYRVVADNCVGRNTSGVESFRTNAFAVATPPPIINQVIRVISGEAEVPAEEVVKLTLESDKSNVSDNRITYIVTYENLTNRTLRDASIEVNLPDELEFDDASRSVDEVRGNTLVFRLGTIRAGERGEIEIDTTASNLEAGDVITVTATLSYIDTNNVRYIVAVEDVSEITAEDLAGGNLTATMFDAFRDFLANPIFWLLIILLLLYLIYRFLTARREPPMYPPAGSGGPTVVTYPPQPPRTLEGPPFG